MPDSHPSLPRFDLIQPASLAEASQFLGEHSADARPFLGGTDLFVRLRDRHIQLNYLLDLKNLPGMHDLHFDPQAGLTIGGAVPMNQVIAFPQVHAHYPLLAEAAASVASYQLRNRATIVGNICNASPAGDTNGATLAYQSELRVYSTGGERTIPLADFFLAPGKTALKVGEIVTAIHIPIPPPGHRAHYLKLGRNTQSDLSIVGVAVMGHPDPATASGFSFRIVLASVAPVPLVALQAQILLSQQAITEKTIEEAARAASHACQPIDDVRASAEYRKSMVLNLTRQALLDVWQQLQFPPSIIKGG